MLNLKNKALIDFRPISLCDKEVYDKALASEQGRGCEFTFANLYLWGRQNIAFAEGGIALFSQFNRRSVYPYPIGCENKRDILDAIIADAENRGIPCRITGLSHEAKQTLEEFYPLKFRFHHDEGSFDYVYAIDDLADLPGKRYHGKRGHLKNFFSDHPNFETLPLTDSTIYMAEELAETWYREREEENPNSDYIMERAALKKAFRCHKELGMSGIVLAENGRALAFALGNHMAADTFDVNFEKASSAARGAYAAVNYEFARYLRENHPEIKYIDREEDMGLEGLRRAKKSYHPHHMIEKFWACLLEEGYEY